MRIITISREFGSGGRELGKRLADEFGFVYYDREIVSAVAESMDMDEADTKGLLDHGVSTDVPVTFSRTLSGAAALTVRSSYALGRQNSIIKALGAKGDCVIVGRGADALLREYQPFSVFVYASMASRVERCKARATAEEQRSDKEWERLIRSVDRTRAKTYEMISGASWGDMHAYRLCLDATGTEIRDLIPSVAAYARTWFEATGQ